MKAALLLIAAFFAVQLSEAQWVRTIGPSGQVFSLAASGPNIFAGNDNGNVFRSTNNGTSWTSVSSGSMRGRTDALAISDTNLFAANDVSVFRSTDNGTSWTATGLANLGAQALALSPNGTGGTNLLAGTYASGVFRSANNGTSWSAVNSGLTGSALYITALFVSDTNLFAGTWGGSAFRSTNNGTTWTPASSGLTSNNVHAFTVSPNSKGGTNLFAGTYFGSGVYLSTDNGGSWTAAGIGLTNSNVRALARFGSSLFAGTDGGGVFLSNNNGASWTEVNAGLTNMVVNALVVSPDVDGSGANLVAGTGDGAWRRLLSEMITSLAETQDGVSPGTFELKQSYPNPFNPTTTIIYELPKPSDVKLSVFDMLGREVSVLVNEKEEAGVHEVKFSADRGSPPDRRRAGASDGDSRGLASGVYFYRLTAGLFVQTRRMILIR